MSLHEYALALAGVGAGVLAGNRWASDEARWAGIVALVAGIALSAILELAGRSA